MRNFITATLCLFILSGCTSTSKPSPTATLELAAAATSTITETPTPAATKTKFGGNDGMIFFVNKAGNSLERIELPSPDVIEVHKSDEYNVDQFAISPDGRYIAFVTDHYYQEDVIITDEIYLLDLESNEAKMIFKSKCDEMDYNVYQVKWDNDSEHLFFKNGQSNTSTTKPEWTCRGEVGIVRLSLETLESEALLEFTAADKGISGPFDLYPDGSGLILGKKDGIYQLLFDGGSELKQIIETDGEVHSLDLSPDGKNIAYATHNGGYLNDGFTKDGQYLGKSMHNYIEWSSNGKMILGMWQDESITVWDVDNKKRLTEITIEGCQVNAAAWSPDGTNIGFLADCEGKLFLEGKPLGTNQAFLFINPRTEKLTDYLAIIKNVSLRSMVWI